MRSVRIQAWGGPDVLRLEELQVEAPGAGEVRLRIRAIGINRTEITLRSGHSPAKPELPSKIGFEAAGEIDAIGSGVEGFARGDRVALVPTYSAAKYGLYGELSLAPARALVPISEGVSFEQAAAMWVSFGTAWAGLIDHGHLTAGQTVLITAASSSVGLAAIQIARQLGARPIAVTRQTAKTDALRAHGAEAVLVSDQQEVKSAVRALTDGRGVDLVFDPVAGSTFGALAEVTASGGTLILYGALSSEPTVVPPFTMLSRELTVRGLSLTAVTRDDEKLAELKRFVADGFTRGLFKTTIARTFTLDDIAAAHRFVEAGEQVGKVVITL